MESKKLDLAMSILRYGFGIIGVVLCALLFVGPNTTAPTDEIEAFREGWQLSSAISFTGLMMFLCVAIVLIFFIVQLITNTKKTVLSIVGILIALGLYLILSLVGTADNSASLQLKDPVSDGTVASTTAGLYTVFIGLAVSIVVILLGPFMGKMRK